jgi:hypothetical protein
MSEAYPNYDKSHTKHLVEDFWTCLMQEYENCPEKMECDNECLCCHPDCQKFSSM